MFLNNENKNCLISKKKIKLMKKIKLININPWLNLSFLKERVSNIEKIVFKEVV